MISFGEVCWCLLWCGECVILVVLVWCDYLVYLLCYFFLSIGVKLVWFFMWNCLILEKILLFLLVMVWLWNRVWLCGFGRSWKVMGCWVCWWNVCNVLNGVIVCWLLGKCGVWIVRLIWLCWILCSVCNWILSWWLFLRVVLRMICVSVWCWSEFWFCWYWCWMRSLICLDVLLNGCRWCLMVVCRCLWCIRWVIIWSMLLVMFWWLLKVWCVEIVFLFVF